MLWVWIGVMVVSFVVEALTMEIVSIWFMFGAIIPLILAATKAVDWVIQLVIFFAVSIVLILSLQKVTKKWLLRNSKEKTNLDVLIGKECRMLSRTDFENFGSVKINGVVWSAVAENQETIEKDEIVEIVKIDGNKLIVKKIPKKVEETKEEVVEEKKETTKKTSKKSKGGK